MVPDPVYLVMRGNEYLEAMLEIKAESRKRVPIFSIYKYDAARITEIADAKTIARMLISKGEEWHVALFRPWEGDMRIVWTLKDRQ